MTFRCFWSISFIQWSVGRQKTKKLGILNCLEVIIKAYDTHNATHFRSDIATISHCVQADTLDANSQWKSQVQMKTLCIYVGKQLCGENVFTPKNICIYSSHSFWVYKFTTVGEALIDLVHQYPALWDKQDAMYKDTNYKEARWKEIAEILHLNKGRCDKEVEVFEGHLC